jgi:hypothetical protein
VALRSFTTLDQLRSAPFDLPSTLLATAEDRAARGDAWSAHHHRQGGRETWTLVLADEKVAVQWRDGERHSGAWVDERQAVRLEERRAFGLYNLEGRRVPQDPYDDEEEASGYDTPAFGQSGDRPKR